MNEGDLLMNGGIWAITGINEASQGGKALAIWVKEHREAGG